MDFKISLQRDAGRSVASSAAFAGASRERRGQGKSDFFWHFVPNILGYLAPQYVPNTFSTRLQLVVKAGAKIFGKGHHLKCGYRISGDSYNSGWAQDGLGERACARRKTQISQEIQLTQILSIPSSASYRASTHCPSAIVTTAIYTHTQGSGIHPSNPVYFLDKFRILLHANDSSRDNQPIRSRKISKHSYHYGCSIIQSDYTTCMM